MKITWAGEQFRLLSERCLFWENEQALLLSDIHLGKAQSLRSQGIAFPAASGLSDILRMQKLVEQLQPVHIFVLGDFIHGSASWTSEVICVLHEFFSQVSATVILGNHERHSTPYLRQLPLTVIENHLQIRKIRLAHGHEHHSFEHEISGHVHPMLSMKLGSTRVRLPCFVVRTESILLPAFGEWTRGVDLEMEPDTRYFACAPREVFEVPTRL